MDTSPVVTGCPLRCHEPTYAVQQIARLFDCLAGIRATLWNVGATMTAYSVLMLAARITFAHFSVSSAMSLPKSAGEPTNGVPPRSASFALHFGIGESSVDVFVELVHDLDRCGLGRADAEPRARLIVRQELVHGRDVRQRVRSCRGRYHERAQPASLETIKQF